MLVILWKDALQQAVLIQQADHLLIMLEVQTTLVVADQHPIAVGFLLLAPALIQPHLAIRMEVVHLVHLLVLVVDVLVHPLTVLGPVVRPLVQEVHGLRALLIQVVVAAVDVVAVVQVAEDVVKDFLYLHHTKIKQL
jgi:hypothetical protein